jgi:polysaccharide pyruvyl transferase WcaK-like protein
MFNMFNMFNMRKKNYLVNVLVVGVAGFNRGDDFIAASLIKTLKKNSQLGSVTITVQRTGIFPAEEVTEILLSRRSIYFHLTLIRALANSRIVVIGGGSIIQDEFGASWWNGIMSLFVEVTFFARLLGCKVVTAPIGVDDLKSDLGKRIAKFILARCDRIFVRDHVSLSNCGELVDSKKNIELSCDPAFFLKTESSEQCRSIHELVVAPAFEGRNESHVINLLVTAIEIYLNSNDLRYCKLIAMEERVSEDAGKLERLKLAVSARLRSKVKIVIPKNYKDAIVHIRGAERLLAMRLHAMIIAYSYMPIYCLSRGTKTDAIAQELDIPYYSLRTGNSDDLFIEAFSHFIESSVNSDEFQLNEVDKNKLLDGRFVLFENFLSAEINRTSRSLKY